MRTVKLPGSVTIAGDVKLEGEVKKKHEKWGIIWPSGQDALHKMRRVLPVALGGKEIRRTNSNHDLSPE